MKPNKTVESAANRVPSGWYPSSARFRQDFNAALTAAVRKIADHGDTGWITKLLRIVDVDRHRQEMIEKITSTHPLKYMKFTESFKVKSDNKNFDWKNADHIDIFEKSILSDGKIIKTGKDEFTVDQFISEVVDALIFSRKEIRSDHLELLSETISAISKGKTKNRGAL